MEPNTNNTTRNWIIGIVVVIALIIIGRSVWSNSPKVINNYDFGNATGTSATSSNNSGTSANGGRGSNGTSVNGTNNSGNVAANSLINNDAALKSHINNLGVRIPETGVDIALANGVGTASVNTQKYSLTAGPILGKVKTEDGHDVFVDMTLTKTSSGSTGSTKIKYVASYHVKDDVVLFKSAVLIGSNVEVRGVIASADKSLSVSTNSSVMNSAKGYILTVNYLDRKNGEPVTTAPSVASTLVLHVKNHIVTK